MQTDLLQQQIRHLHWRAGFGLSMAEATLAYKSTLQQNVESLFTASKKYDNLMAVELNGEVLGDMMSLSDADKKDFLKQARKNMILLNLAWLEKLTTDPAQLREKMTLFWHGHFACNIDNPAYAQKLNNTIRKNAMGKFSDLILAVSQEAAMLLFLNNKQNKKSAPNENFAREVMELFTIGRGNYTEQDVKEAARAFTGWVFDENGDFKMKENQHDFDEKTFMGKTGNFNGDDVLSIILENKQTAKFLCTKIWKFFVSDQPDNDRIEELATSFFNSGYDIEALMRQIFNSDWFYETKNLAVHIKSPVEYLVSMNRNFPIEFSSDQASLILQKLMAQVLFRPPNVAGWAGGQAWIDSSSIMLRLKLPQIILGNKTLDMDVKEEFDRDAITMDEENKKNHPFQSIGALKVKVDLTDYSNTLANVSDDELLKVIASHHLQVDLEKINTALIEKYKAGDTREDNIRYLTMAVMSLPEYQLC